LSLRNASAALSLTLLLVGCGTQVTPGEPIASSRWWLGNWQVDLEALDAEAHFIALTPEARAVVRAALEANAWRLGIDSARVHLPDGRAVPYTLEQTAPDTVVLRNADAVLLRLVRTGADALRTDKELPLERAD
jgi:hypothetical protein